MRVDFAIINNILCAVIFSASRWHERIHTNREVLCLRKDFDNRNSDSSGLLMLSPQRIIG